MARFQRGDETREAVGIDAQLALLADGFARLSTRKIDDTDEPRDAELERAIHESPDDDQAWLVYADLLLQRGHPRGPLVAIESAPVKNIVERAEREAESRRLRLAARDLLAGSLSGRAGLNLTWKRGFIHSAKIAGAFEADGAEELLVDLLAHPSARFLRDFELDCYHHSAKDHRLLAALLLNAPSPPPLKKLVIAYETMEWTGYPPLGDIGALGEVYPQLADVHLDASTDTRLDGLALPRATRFRFSTTEMSLDVARAIGAAPWPALQVLHLDLFACTVPMHVLTWVFGLPQLRVLRARNAPFAREIVAAFVNAPIAAQIENLDLGEVPLDDPHVAVLVKARDRLHAKFRIDARFTQEGREMLDEANIEYERWWW